MLQGLDLFLHGTRADQLVDEHRLVLADAMGAIGGLRFDGRIPPRVVVDHGIGRGEIEAHATGLQADQEDGYLASLEARDEVCAFRGGRLPGEHLPGELARVERLRNQFEHLRKLAEHQHAPAFVDETAEQIQQQLQLGRMLDAPCAFKLDQARIAADLAQLQQRIDDDDAALREAALAHFGEDALVLGQAQAFVEFTLRAIEIDVARDDGFFRQVGEHVFLAPAQQQGRNAPAEALATFGIVVLFDRRAEEAREVTFVAEQSGFDCIELRPQFAEVVFQRRARHGQAATSGDFAHHACRLALGVLHHLRFIEDEQGIFMREQGLTITCQQRIGGDDEVVVRNGFMQSAAAGTVHDQHAQCRSKALRLAAPVGNEAGRRDDHGWLIETPALLLRQQVGEHLHGLAKAHVVGQNATEVGVGEESEPGQAVALVATQAGLESFRLTGRLACFAQSGQLFAQVFGAAPGQLAARRELIQHCCLRATQAQHALFGIAFRQFLQPFQQRRHQVAQSLQRQGHAPPLVDRHQPHRIGILALARSQWKARISEQAAQDRQQVDAFTADVDAKAQVEPGIAGLLDLGIPLLGLVEQLERKTGIGFQAKTVLAHARRQRKQLLGGQQLAATWFEHEVTIGKHAGARHGHARQQLHVDQAEGFELFAGGNLGGAITHHFQQATLVQASFARFGRCKRQAWAFVVEAQAHAAGLVAVGHALRISEYRKCAQSQHRGGRHPMHLRRFRTGRFGKPLQMAVVAPVFDDELGFFRPQGWRAHGRIDQACVTIHATECLRGWIVVPDLRNAQQAGASIAFGQLRHQLLVALLRHAPAPGQLTVFAEGGATLRRLVDETGVFLKQDFQQGLITLAVERVPGTRCKVRTGHAQTRHMFELTRRQALPGVNAVLEVANRLG